jgi:hypothetical protein
MEQFILDLILPFIGNPYFNVVTAAVTLASAICALTPTPAEGTWQSKVYKVVEFLAINIGKAKDKGK